jgi:hypothetical protein
MLAAENKKHPSIRATMTFFYSVLTKLPLASLPLKTRDIPHSHKIPITFTRIHW